MVVDLPQPFGPKTEDFGTTHAEVELVDGQQLTEAFAQTFSANDQIIPRHGQ